MYNSIKAAKELTRPQLIFAFIVFSGLVAPGAATLWVFDSTFVYEKSAFKILLFSFVLTSAPALFNFVVISVYGLMRGHPRDTQRSSTEFTFSLMAVAASYFIMVLVSLLWAPIISVFTCGAIAINVLVVACLIILMDQPAK